MGQITLVYSTLHADRWALAVIDDDSNSNTTTKTSCSICMLINNIHVDYFRNAEEGERRVDVDGARAQELPMATMKWCWLHGHTLRLDGFNHVGIYWHKLELNQQIQPGPSRMHFGITIPWKNNYSSVSWCVWRGKWRSRQSHPMFSKRGTASTEEGLTISPLVNTDRKGEEPVALCYNNSV